MLTDVDAVYTGWGTPAARAIRRASPDAIAALPFAAGSMGPKVEAACAFVRKTSGIAVIGALDDAPRLLRGQAGTTVTVDAGAIEWAG
jgi:carbamate kinase